MLKLKEIFASYKETICNKNNIYLYIIYFSFFVINGPLEQSISLLFEGMHLNQSVYATFLSLNNAVGVFLPSAVAFLTLKYNGGIIAICGIAVSILGGILVGRFSGGLIPILLAIILFSGRTFFNYSFGSEITYRIPSNQRAKFFVVRDLFLFGGISFGLMIAARIVKSAGIDQLYVFYSIGFIISIYFIFVYGKKSGGDHSPEANTGGDQPKLSNLALLRDKKILSFIIIRCFTTIYGITTAFNALLGTRLGISASHVISLLGIVTLINSVLSILFAHLSDRFGKKALFVTDIAIDMIPSLIFFFTKSIGLYSFGLFISLFKDAFAPISYAYFFDCLGKKKAILSNGLIASITNALGIFAPLAIGFLWKHSYRMVFLVGAVSCCAAALIAVFTLPGTAESDAEA